MLVQACRAMLRLPKRAPTAPPGAAALHRSLPAFGLLTAFVPTLAAAQGVFDLSGHRWSFVAEGGVLATPTIDVQGYRQSNATAGWSTTAATFRAEAWLTRPDALNIGIVLQPLDLSFRGITDSRLTARGQDIPAGEPGKLRYRFSSVRLSANYDFWPGEAAELRVGVTLIARYVDIELTAPSGRVSRSNALAVPLLNIEGRLPFGDNGLSGVARMDAFPAPNGTGLYDIFAGVRLALDGGRALEFGGRTFYGGYLPDQPGNVGNRIFFQGAVGRVVF